MTAEDGGRTFCPDEDRAASDTWSKDARISDAISGPGYINARGFLADYSDYGGIDIMSDGKTIAAWSEAYPYDGPGGVWINRSP